MGTRLASAGQLPPLVVAQGRCKDMQTKGELGPLSVSQNPSPRPSFSILWRMHQAVPERSGQTPPCSGGLVKETHPERGGQAPITLQLLQPALKGRPAPPAHAGGPGHPPATLLTPLNHASQLSWWEKPTLPQGPLPPTPHPGLEAAAAGRVPVSDGPQRGASLQCRILQGYVSSLSTWPVSFPRAGDDGSETRVMGTHVSRHFIVTISLMPLGRPELEGLCRTPNYGKEAQAPGGLGTGPRAATVCVPGTGLSVYKGHLTSHPSSEPSSHDPHRPDEGTEGADIEFAQCRTPRKWPMRGTRFHLTLSLSLFFWRARPPPSCPPGPYTGLHTTSDTAQRQAASFPWHRGVLLPCSSKPQELHTPPRPSTPIGTKPTLASISQHHSVKGLDPSRSFLDCNSLFFPA